MKENQETKKSTAQHSCTVGKFELYAASFSDFLCIKNANDAATYV